MGGLSGISSGYGLQSWIQAIDTSSLAVTNAASEALAADLVDCLVGSDLASYGVKASIAALRTADAMLGTVIDLQA